MDRRLENLVLREETRASILRAARAQADSTVDFAEAARAPRPLYRKRRRLIATVAAACLTVVFSLGVVAAAFPEFDWFIGRMGEDLRGLVHPVGQTVTDDGIRMDVLAAVNDGDMAVIYLGLTDETGERIDERTQLYDLNVGGDHYLWGPQVDFDPETGTAIYRMETYRNGLEKTEKFQLELSSILVGVQEQPRRDTGLTVADVVQANPQPQTMPAAEAENAMGDYSVTYGNDPMLEAGASAMMDAAAKMDTGTLPVLARGSAPMDTAWPTWTEVTAAGVVDGMLHLQYQPVDDVSAYALTDYSLAWPGGPSGAMPPDGSGLSQMRLTLGEERQDGSHLLSEAYEDILELPEDVAFEDIRILATGVTCEDYLAGSWRVKLTLEQNPEALTARTAIDMGDWVVEEIAVTSIGAKVMGHGEQTMASELADLAVYLKDGTRVRSDSASAYGDSDGLVQMRSCFARPIDLAEVDRVELNGVAYPLEPQK